MTEIELIAMGASWGGLKAVGDVLAGLHDDFPAPVVVAQHRDPDTDDTLLRTLLGRRTGLTICEAEDKDELVRGKVLLAPPGYHLLVEERGSVALSVDEPVHFSRPSIDVLLESAAEAYGSRLVGVVLTGANDDGAAGLAA